MCVCGDVVTAAAVLGGGEGGRREGRPGRKRKKSEMRWGGAGEEGSGLYRRETQTERAGPARRKGGRLVDLGGKKGACGGGARRNQGD